MSPQLIVAVVTILLAALLYSIAVFVERRDGTLRPWHVALFWAGLVFDTTGTTLMGGLVGGFEWNLHGTLGVVAIALMLFHALWATFAIWQQRAETLANFHTFSVTVWALWMLTLVTGFGIALRGMFGA